MPTERIPLVGSIQTRNQDVATSSGRDQIFKNCYPIVSTNPITGKALIELVKRPGSTLKQASVYDTSSLASTVFHSTGATGNTLAMSWRNNAGTIVKIFNSANNTQIGGDLATTSVCKYLIETAISGVVNLVGVFTDSDDGADELWFYPEGGSWTKVSDGDFPPNQTPAISIVGSPAQLDGYLFQMVTNGAVYNSDLNSLSSWTANNFIQCSISADGGAGCAKYRDFIVGFNTGTTEFFKNNGNPTGSPLVSVGSAGFGAIPSTNRRTIFQYGNDVYFFGFEDETGLVGLFKLNGTDRTKVSTTAIDSLMGVNGVIVGVMQMHRMRHLLIWNVTTSRYFALCLDNGFWWEYVGWLITQVGYNNNTADTRIAVNASGALYAIPINADTSQDDGAAYSLTVQTAPIDLGTVKEKSCARLTLIGDKYSSANVVTVSFSDDDAVNFTTAGTIDLSTDQNFIMGLGTFKRRVWKFVSSSNNPLRLEAFELDYTVTP